LIFTEVQRFRDTWLWPALLAPAIIASLFVSYVVVEAVFLDDDGIMARDAFALGICFYVLKGVGVLVLALYAARLEIEVRSAGLFIRLAPFQRKHRHVTNEQLRKAVIRRVVRGRRKGWRSYGMKGKEAVELVTSNGDRLIIGTQQPAKLVEALSSQAVA
jgi:hypothetical protein